jgi:hypothetical protein
MLMAEEGMPLLKEFERMNNDCYDDDDDTMMILL